MVVPVVSVICLAFNHENFIRECLDGFVIQQCNFNIEVIVHDDASTDGTSDIIREYEKKHPQIFKPIYQKVNQYTLENGRVTRICFNAAKGKYIAMCEGDDYWTDPLKLQKQVDFLEANEDYVITYGDIEAFDENGVKENVYGGAKRDLTKEELMECTPINTLTACFRNLIEVFPPEMNCARIGDLFLWSLLGNHGKGKYIDSIKPCRYRVHAGGVFSKESKEKKHEMWLITSSALYAYYCRIGNEKMKTFFHQKSLVSSLGLFGVINFGYYILLKLLKIK